MPGDSHESKLCPLASFIIIAYEQEKFIRDAIVGAFSQTYTNLEIILSDDCSSDGTYSVMEEMATKYRGPHTVRLNRNRKNLGIAGHVNTVVEMAKGEIIVLAAGDDISLPERTVRSVELMSGNTTAVSFRHHRFSGPPPETVKRQGEHQTQEIRVFSWHQYLTNPEFHIGGSTRSFKKSAFDLFGPIQHDCPTEDSVILLRALLAGRFVYADDVQVLYRIHESNTSSPTGLWNFDFASIHDQYVRDIQRAMELQIISTDEAHRLKRSLETRLKRTSVMKRFDAHPRPAVGFVKHILFSPAFDGMFKLKMFLKIALACAGLYRLQKKYSPSSIRSSNDANTLQN